MRQIAARDWSEAGGLPDAVATKCRIGLKSLNLNGCDDLSHFQFHAPFLCFEFGRATRRHQPEEILEDTIIAFHAYRRCGICSGNLFSDGFSLNLRDCHGHAGEGDPTCTCFANEDWSYFLD